MKKETKFVYVCGNTWDFELGETDVLTYPDIEYLKEETDCWKECGIVKLKVTLEEVCVNPKPWGKKW